MKFEVNENHPRPSDIQLIAHAMEKAKPWGYNRSWHGV